MLGLLAINWEPELRGILIVIIAGTTTLYISNWLPTEVTSTIAIAALVLTGILTPDQALSGFASTATVTVAAMFVLSAGLMRTGALEAVTLQLGRFAKGNATRLLLLLAAVEIPASAFMNNTPVVVMMVPVVGLSVPQIICSSVDLPLPLRPMMPTVSPFLTSNETSFSAQNSR